MSKALPTKLTGFTLIEMLMVILIIAATTKIVAVSMQDFGFAARYEQTVSRLDTIRQSIAGNPKRTINGQPDISGFVADMGRLPDNIRELMQSFVCINTSTNTVVLGDTPAECNGVNETLNYLSFPCSDNTQTTQAACVALVAPNNTWVGKKLDSSGLSYGWQGPYLITSDSPNNTDTYTDGWGNESADNYGWLTCLWDDVDDGAGGGLINSLPNDTDAAPSDGIANCSNSQTYPNFTLYSLGKNGQGDVNADGVTGCNSDNTYDGDCYSSILEEDYTVDISSGISVSIKKDNSNIGGNCSFPASLADSLILDDKGASCRNASGSASSACYLTEIACEGDGVLITGAGGIWSSTNNFCEFTIGSCSGTGQTWDSATKTCHIAKTQCTAVTVGGVWTGAVPLTLSPAICASKGGVWNDDTELCLYAANTNCIGTGINQLSGKWDATSTTCDYKNTLLTPTDWAVGNGGNWGCSISQASCNKAGGAWNRCDFNPVDCNAITGASWVSACEFTDSNCVRIGGSWNPNTRACTFSTSTKCNNAGFNWNGLSCDVPTQDQCKNANIAWDSYCQFNTGVNCASADGVWNNATTPKQCEFSSTNCLAQGGSPRVLGNQCSITQAEHNGIPFNTQSCEQAQGVWSDKHQSICAKIFYRSINSTVIFAESLPVNIAENGREETVRFSSFFDGGGNVVNIAQGNNALGIYEHDGTNCTNTFYPSDRSEPVQMLFISHITLPVVNW